MALRRLSDMTPIGSRTIGAAVLALLLLGCTDGTEQPHPSPGVSSPAAIVRPQDVRPSIGTPVSPSLVPTAPPRVTVHGGHDYYCTWQHPSGSAPAVTPTAGSEQQGALPSGVTAEWLPGLNQRPCRATLTHSGAAVAQRLAALIDQSKVVPPGEVFSCPLDDDSEVKLFFSYAGDGVRTIWVPLTGCAFLGDTSGKDLLMAPAALLAVLRSIAPLPWRSQLYGGN